MGAYSGIKTISFPSDGKTKGMYAFYQQNTK